MDTIIQWNCRGLKSNFDELSLLINNHKPVAVCLQETFLKRGDDISIKYHSIYNKVFTDGEKARGGVSIIVSNNIPHKVISLNTNLQAVAIRLSLHSAVTPCSLYLPPSTPINETSLNDLIPNCHPPLFLLEILMVTMLCGVVMILTREVYSWKTLFQTTPCLS